jgi:hypothetical protein
MCLGPRLVVGDEGAEVVEAGTTGWRLVSARRGHILCPDKGSVHRSVWPYRKLRQRVL